MKVILIINNENNEIKKEYKSLKAIHKDYPDYDYHTLRQIYLQSTNQVNHNMHSKNKVLFHHIKIIDKELPAII